MKAAGFVLAILPFAAFGYSEALAQSKGIDTQTQQIRDVGNGQGPTDNGNKRNVGSGRGIDFGAGKTPDRVILSNPYRLPSKRDILLATISDIMTQRNLVVDEAASRPADGILITQPFTFAKGAVLAGSQISRLANIPQGDINGGSWTRGRYTLRVEVQSIDGINNNISVIAKVEAREETPIGANWQTLESNGTVEQEFLNALVETVTGTSPNATPKPAQP
ncbi:MAG TPA: hypothetical protein VEX64_06905 [Pyrinomonadaceae bacterium]|jgi:hypothetical protein|nr:hypothetical protein [Pyrinomonadaceae bacterium]